MKLIKHRKGNERGQSGLAPYRDINRIRNELNRIFQEPLAMFEPTASLFGGWEPNIDVYDDKDKITVKAELPGMKKEDIDISVEGDMLTISGERKEEHEEKQGETYRSERYFGHFQRSLRLSQSVDPNKVQANYKDGVLTIALPKTEQSKPKQIDVKIS